MTSLLFQWSQTVIPKEPISVLCRPVTLDTRQWFSSWIWFASYTNFLIVWCLTETPSSSASYTQSPVRFWSGTMNPCHKPNLFLCSGRERTPVESCGSTIASPTTLRKRFVFQKGEMIAILPWLTPDHEGPQGDQLILVIMHKGTRPRTRIFYRSCQPILL